MCLQNKKEKKGSVNTKEYIENGIKNIKETLDWEKSELELCRMALIKRASECTAEDIAHGYLGRDISGITRQVEKVRSLNDQLTLLQYIQNHAD